MTHGGCEDETASRIVALATPAKNLARRHSHFPSKAPTVRRWNSKIAVAVDRPFFESIGGPSPTPTQDVNDGDIIWRVPDLSWDGDDGRFRLARGHWEVLTLEESTDKLLAARTISRDSFETALRDKLDFP